ncbi:hypothetical protein FRC03_003445 [Tulasnella sp. 419]|nr:hypothetical protein FRC03_003445 [Tulasnella sp. 419]
MSRGVGAIRIAPWIKDFLLEHRNKHGEDFRKRLDGPHARKCQIFKLRTRRTDEQKRKPMAVWADISDSESYITAKFEGAAVLKLEANYSDAFDPQLFNLISLRRFHSEKCIVPGEGDEARPVIVVEEAAYVSSTSAILGARGLKRALSMVRDVCKCVPRSLLCRKKLIFPVDFKVGKIIRRILQCRIWRSQETMGHLRQAMTRESSVQRMKSHLTPHRLFPTRKSRLSSMNDISCFEDG